MSRWSDPEGKNTRKTIFMQARKNEEKTLPAALRTLCEKTKVIIWDEMLSSGANFIIWVEMLSSGANVIIWDEILSSEIKCNHLELMLSSGTKLYHLG